MSRFFTGKIMKIPRPVRFPLPNTNKTGLQTLPAIGISPAKKA